MTQTRDIHIKKRVAILIEKADTALLLSALKTLLNDTEIYATIQKNCLLAADSLNWENEQLRLIEFYKNVR